jgi:hypothetical protein
LALACLFLLLCCIAYRFAYGGRIGSGIVYRDLKPAQYRERNIASPQLFTESRQLFTESRQLFTKSRQLFTESRQLFTESRQWFRYRAWRLEAAQHRECDDGLYVEAY